MITNVILDTGPLVASLDRDEMNHEWAVEQLRLIQTPLYSCEAVLTEACFLLGGLDPAVTKIREYIRSGYIEMKFELWKESERVFELMRSYRNIPMSFADACLVVMIENVPGGRILTLDSDFRIYRQKRRRLIPLITPQG